MIQNFMLELIENAPHPRSVKAGFRNQLDALITEGLQASPEEHYPAGGIVMQICEELGLECSFDQLPDDLVRPHPNRPPNTPEQQAEIDRIVHHRIYGHDPPP